MPDNTKDPSSANPAPPDTSSNKPAPKTGTTSRLPVRSSATVNSPPSAVSSTSTAKPAGTKPSVARSNPSDPSSSNPSASGTGATSVSKTAGSNIPRMTQGAGTTSSTKKPSATNSSTTGISTRPDTNQSQEATRPASSPTATRPGSRTGNTEPGNVNVTRPYTKASASERRLVVFEDPPGQDLTYHDDLPKEKEMKSSDPLFIIMSHCVDNAMRMMEHPKGRDALIESGNIYVDNKKPQDVHVKVSPDKMGAHVDKFLKAIAEDFPSIQITGAIDSDAAVFRTPWENLVNRYPPKSSAQFVLNKKVILNPFSLLLTNIF